MKDSITTMHEWHLVGSQKDFLMTRLAWQNFLLLQLSCSFRSNNSAGSRPTFKLLSQQAVEQILSVRRRQTSMSSLLWKVTALGCFPAPEVWRAKIAKWRDSEKTHKKTISWDHLIWNPRWKYVNIQIRSSWFKFHGVEIFSEHASKSGWKVWRRTTESFGSDRRKTCRRRSQ